MKSNVFMMFIRIFVRLNCTTINNYVIVCILRKKRLLDFEIVNIRKYIEKFFFVVFLFDQNECCLHEYEHESNILFESRGEIF